MVQTIALSLLNKVLKICSSETKYFLVRYAIETDFAFPVELNVENISKQLRLNRSHSGKAMRELVSAGYLSEEAVYENRRGRPKKRYNITAKLDLENTSQASATHENLILDLLKTDSRDKDGHRRHELKIPARLLLATLLSQANDRGVVQSAGTAFLAGLTGMSGERVRNNIAKLRSLGYIRQICPGISSRQLFGTIGSAFILNLHHRRWRENSSGSHLWLINFEGSGNRLPTLEAYLLIQLALTCIRANQKEFAGMHAALHELAQGPRLFQLQTLGKRLPTKNPYRLADRLQFQLEMTASAILTEETEHLVKGSFHWKHRIVETVIKNTALPEKLFINEEYTASVLADLFYRVAWKMAQKRFPLIYKTGKNGAILLHHPIVVTKPSGLPGMKHLAIESIHKHDRLQSASLITVSKTEGQEIYPVLERNEHTEFTLNAETLKRFILGNTTL